MSVEPPGYHHADCLEPVTSGEVPECLVVGHHLPVILRHDGEDSLYLPDRSPPSRRRRKQRVPASHRGGGHRVHRPRQGRHRRPAPDPSKNGGRGRRHHGIRSVRPREPAPTPAPRRPPRMRERPPTRLRGPTRWRAPDRRSPAGSPAGRRGRSRARPHRSGSVPPLPLRHQPLPAAMSPTIEVVATTARPSSASSGPPAQAASVRARSRNLPAFLISCL